MYRHSATQKYNSRPCQGVHPASFVLRSGNQLIIKACHSTIKTKVQNLREKSKSIFENQIVIKLSFFMQKRPFTIKRTTFAP